MRRLILLFLTSTGILFGACGQLPPATTRPEMEDDFEPPIATKTTVPGSYIVTFRNDLAGQTLNTGSWLAEFSTYSTMLNGRILGDGRVRSVDYLATVDMNPDDGASQDSGWFFLGQKMAYGLPIFDFQKQDPISGVIARVDFDSESDATEVISEWQENGVIWFAEPNQIADVNQDTPAPGNVFGKLAKEYDSQGGDRWWLDRIRLTKAFEALSTRDQSAPDTLSDAALGSTPPIIAVFDSGVDYLHPALADRMWTNPSQNSAGCKGDLHGCDTTTARKGKLGTGEVHPFGTSAAGEKCPPETSTCGHGTHVAGLIAADHLWSDTNGRSPGGVCPVCKIMAIRVVSKTDSGSGILDSSLLAGFQYVQRFRKSSGTRVRVINCSFGKFTRSRAVALVMRSLRRDGPGTLIVSAAGNEDTIAMEYPAAYTDGIAVAAVDQRNRKTVYSNFGRWVDISAPGHQLLSTIPGDGLEEKPGTSMAAPLVSAVAGLMLVRSPNLSFAELRKWLIESADPSLYDQNSDEGYNFNHYYPKIKGESARLPLLGFGVLNAENAVLRKSTGDLPIYNKLDRVEPGCGKISGARILPDRAENGQNTLGLLALLLPLLWLLATHAVKLFKSRQAR